MVGSACKYFGWAEKDVMRMSYEKFTMYLATIPSYDEEETGESETPAKKTQVTGSFNLFDFDTRFGNKN